MAQPRTLLPPFIGMLAALSALLLAACQVQAVPGPAPETGPVIKITSGPVEGLPLGAHGGVFKGIPFADPPIGNLRWTAPQPVTPWDGTRLASVYAPACPQGEYTVSWYGDVIDAFGGDRALAARPAGESEDCLYLNVWSSDLSPDTARPVMVWIHGGAYKGGWSYEPNYVGATLAEKGVLVVSIGYRLGPFGYIGPGETSNFGLMDQIAALEWVQANIAQFDGDPSNVTVFGESAGASSIGTLLVTPSARGLFQRAIHQSGGFEFLDDAPALWPRDAHTALADAIAPANIAAASSAEILSASNTALADHWFAPAPDGAVLPDHPAALLEAGAVAPVDLMIGTNRDEWLMYLDPQTVEADLSTWRDRLPDAGPLIDAMVAADGTAGALDRLETADQMRCPGRKLARAVASAGGDVFAYRFSRVRPSPTDPELGSYHGAEIPYVFGTHDDWLPTDDTDRRLTDAMMAAWVAFARTGDPTTPALEWPDVTTTGQVLELGDAITLAAPMDDALCPHIAAYRSAARD